LSGDLTPECTALINTVLGALSAPRGAGDTRSHEQRYHDALEEAMHRLVSAGLLPERAGQPARVWAHISLADLMVLDARSKLQEQWIERVRGEWAGHRAAASVAGSDGAAWLDGDAAEGFACDASITPVVFGEVNPAVLDDLVRLCVQLAGHGHGRCTPVPAGAVDPAGSGDSGDPAQAAPDPAAPDPGTPQVLQVLLSSPAGLSREALERAIIGKAVALVSGPGGLASFLRREQLGARLAGPSLPLDVGYSDDVPAAIRNAVRLRDKVCQWAGGCHQPGELHPAVSLPPPRDDPPDGLDPGPPPRRHHHGLEPGQNQGPAQPQPTRPRRVTTPVPWRIGSANLTRQSHNRPKVTAPTSVASSHVTKMRYRICIGTVTSGQAET
jgi:hypothetical protein